MKDKFCSFPKIKENRLIKIKNALLSYEDDAFKCILDKFNSLVCTPIWILASLTIIWGSMVVILLGKVRIKYFKLQQIAWIRLTKIWEKLDEFLETKLIFSIWIVVILSKWRGKERTLLSWWYPMALTNTERNQARKKSEILCIFFYSFLFNL